MYLIGLISTNLWTRIAICPNWLLAPVILVFSIIGAYAPRNLFFDIWLTLIFGVVGYFMRKLQYSLPSFILGFILGFLIETNLRRALLMSEGDYGIFFERPISFIFLILALIFLVSGIRQHIRMRKKLAAAENEKKRSS